MSIGLFHDALRQLHDDHSFTCTPGPAHCTRCRSRRSPCSSATRLRITLRFADEFQTFRSLQVRKGLRTLSSDLRQLNMEVRIMTTATATPAASPGIDRAVEALRRSGNPFRNYFARNPDDEVCCRYHVPGPLRGRARRCC